jgi:hypothetical protein
MHVFRFRCVCVCLLKYSACLFKCVCVSVCWLSVIGVKERERASKGWSAWIKSRTGHTDWWGANAWLHNLTQGGVCVVLCVCVHACVCEYEGVKHLLPLPMIEYNYKIWHSWHWWMTCFISRVGRKTPWTPFPSSTSERSQHFSHSRSVHLWLSLSLSHSPTFPSDRLGGGLTVLLKSIQNCVISVWNMDIDHSLLCVSCLLNTVAAGFHFIKSVRGKTCGLARREIERETFILVNCDISI